MALHTAVTECGERSPSAERIPILGIVPRLKASTVGILAVDCAHRRGNGAQYGRVRNTQPPVIKALHRLFSNARRWRRGVAAHPPSTPRRERKRE